MSKRTLIAAAFLALALLPANLVFCDGYSLEVRTDREAYVAGEFVEISGYVKDRYNRPVSTFVEIAILTPQNDSLRMGFTHSDSNGFFLMIAELPKNASLGDYIVTATADESPASAAFKVSLNSVTCSVNPSLAYPETPLSVCGQVYPPRRAEVKLELSKGGGYWQEIAGTYSNSSGFYSFGWKAPREAGNYSIRALLDGAQSLSAQLRVIVKEPTAIFVFLSPSSTVMGKSVQVSGKLDSTSRNATITIRYARPGGGSVNRTVQADEVGGFRDAFKPDEEGTWRISASWPGDAFNEPAESMEAELAVSPEPPTKLFLSIVAAEDAVVLALLARRLRDKRRAKGRQYQNILLERF